jgi:hypothetical protein
MVKEISQKQLDANRRNAQLSTGPKTESGKAIVARNATKHGLLAAHAVIDGESQADFDLLHAEMFAYFEPVGTLEYSLLDKVVISMWQQQRVPRIENEIMDALRDPESEKPDKGGLPFSVTFIETFADKPDEHISYGEPDEQSSEAKSGSSDGPEPKRITLGQAFLKDFEGTNALSKIQRYARNIDSSLYKSIQVFDSVQEKRFKKEIIEAERTDK